jgi:hypothetical protein
MMLEIIIKHLSNVIERMKRVAKYKKYFVALCIRRGRCKEPFSLITTSWRRWSSGGPTPSHLTPHAGFDMVRR